MSGQVEPDTYVVDKTGPSLLHVRVGTQTPRSSRGPTAQDLRVELDRGRGGAAGPLRRRGPRAGRPGAARSRHHYGSPQDTEWAIAGGRTVPRPVPADHHPRDRPPSRPGAAPRPRPGPVSWCSGLAASAGRAVGPGAGAGRPPRRGPAGDRRDPGGPDDQPGLGAHHAPGGGPGHRRRRHDLPRRHRARASSACPASSGPAPPPPCCATASWSPSTGPGRCRLRGRRSAPGPDRRPTAAGRPPVGARRPPARPRPLATRLYVNLAFAEHAEEVAALAVDGVGLLRAEFMVTDALGGIHPPALHRARGGEDLRRRHGGVAAAHHPGLRPRPVVYRSIDFRTNEFRNLSGGERFEPHEENPMIGYRGCFRYVQEPDLFRLELEVLAKVLEQTPNLRLMIPFVRTAWELEACLDVVDASPVGGAVAGVGHGRGALGRLLDPRVRGDGHRGRLDREQRPDPAHARGRPGLAGLRRALRRVRPGRPRRHRAHRQRVPGRPASRRRCAARPPPTGPSSPSTWCDLGITSISVNPDAVDAVRQSIATRRVAPAARGRGPGAGQRLDTGRRPGTGSRPH